MHRSHLRRLAPLGALTLLLGVTACSSDGPKGGDTTAPVESSPVESSPVESTVADTSGTDTTGAAADSTAAAETTAVPAETSVAGAATTTDSTAPGGAAIAIDPARCERNKAAGKITFLTGFDFAAAASIIEVLVARAHGYYAALCLDVDVKSSFSSANYALVAAGKAQFASGGSYTEVARNSPAESPVVAVLDFGKTAIDSLIVPKSKGITSLEQLKGKTIGVKGDLPPSIQAMLAKAGLQRDTDYKTILVDGFDPVQHLALPIDALPGYKSNEPGQLDRATPPIEYELFDPTAQQIPGSFGVVFTSKAFLDAHADAARDFVRATLKGSADAIADPDGAVKIAIDLINGAGNKNYLSPAGEGFRWKTEAALVQSTKGALPIGVIDPALLETEVKAYAEAKAFAAPKTDGTYDTKLAAGVYEADGTLAWPGS